MKDRYKVPTQVAGWRLGEYTADTWWMALLTGDYVMARAAGLQRRVREHCQQAQGVHGP
jgi:hypothetical protein